TAPDTDAESESAFDFMYRSKRMATIAQALAEAGLRENALAAYAEATALHARAAESWDMFRVMALGASQATATSIFQQDTSARLQLERECDFVRFLARGGDDTARHR